jgi:hypothetical protein
MDVYSSEEERLILPPGVNAGNLVGDDAMDGVVVDNQTGLPDNMIRDGVGTFLAENSAYSLRPEFPIEMYTDGWGSMMTRTEFKSPASIPDEIRLARHLAERDDDVAAVLGEMVALAFSDGVQVMHGDERTQALFCAINEEMDIEGVLANMYREWLIASAVTITHLYTRQNLQYCLGSGDRQLEASLATPRVGVLPAENIRVIGNDTFGTAQLAFEPENEKQRRWLREYFDPGTSPARKAELGRLDRAAANMFVGRIAADPYEVNQAVVTGGPLYLLNPRVVQRITMPKGTWKYPRPMMTRDFPLLEAKRLLNVMDYALLQGGSNFIVVAKKGSDQRPATKNEVANLREVVRRASKVGVMVGDHRLSFEIITPKLDELLNSSKRRLVGRKLAMAIMRVAEHSTESADAKGMEAELEIFSRVVSWDRRRLSKFLRQTVYTETARRNPRYLKSPANLWFMRLVLQGLSAFTEQVLKLRDRGDISRRTAVEAAGFDYDAELQERGRELAEGHDETLVPGTVPHTSPDQPGQQPQINDNGGGRPPGAKTGKGPEDGPYKKRTLLKVAGETIKAWFDEDAEVDQVVRMGETTMAVLEDHPDREIGRMTGNEREALSLTEPDRIGSTIYIPVNPAHETAEVRAVRLTDGLSMLIGTMSGSGALVAKALCFREPTFDVRAAEEIALRWGFITRELPELPAPKPDPEPEPAS